MYNEIMCVVSSHGQFHKKENPKYLFAANPCRGGGVCVASTDGYTCRCPEDRSGLNCEHALGACSTEPCKNGGECEDNGDTETFTCTCKPGRWIISIGSNEWGEILMKLFFKIVQININLSLLLYERSHLAELYTICMMPYAPFLKYCAMLSSKISLGNFWYKISISKLLRKLKVVICNLMICKLRIGYGHTWHRMASLRQHTQTLFIFCFYLHYEFVC